jgi:hypothetical protein
MRVRKINYGFRSPFGRTENLVTAQSVAPRGQHRTKTVSKDWAIFLSVAL